MRNNARGRLWPGRYHIRLWAQLTRVRGNSELELDGASPSLRVVTVASGALEAARLDQALIHIRGGPSAYIGGRR